MPTQLLIRSIEEFLDARSFLEAQREHGDALERALERMHNARVKLREQIEATDDASVNLLVEAVGNYIAAEAAFEGHSDNVPGPAAVLEKLHQARRAVTAELRAFLLSFRWLHGWSVAVLRRAQNRA